MQKTTVKNNKTIQPNKQKTKKNWLNNKNNIF